MLLTKKSKKIGRESKGNYFKTNITEQKYSRDVNEVKLCNNYFLIIKTLSENFISTPRFRCGKCGTSCYFHDIKS